MTVELLASVCNRALTVPLEGGTKGFDCARTMVPFSGDMLLLLCSQKAQCCSTTGPTVSSVGRISISNWFKNCSSHFARVQIAQPFVRRTVPIELGSNVRRKTARKYVAQDTPRLVKAPYGYKYKDFLIFFPSKPSVQVPRKTSEPRNFVRSPPLRSGDGLHTAETRQARRNVLYRAAARGVVDQKPFFPLFRTVWRVWLTCLDLSPVSTCIRLCSEMESRKLHPQYLSSSSAGRQHYRGSASKWQSGPCISPTPSTLVAFTTQVHSSDHHGALIFQQWFITPSWTVQPSVMVLCMASDLITSTCL